MIITILVSVSIGCFLGYEYAHHTNIHSILYNLEKQGVLYYAKFIDNSVFDEVLGNVKVHRERYFFTLRSANKWAVKQFCRIKEIQRPCGNWVFITHKGDQIAEFYN